MEALTIINDIKCFFGLSNSNKLINPSGFGNTRGFYCNSGGSELQGIGQSELEHPIKELVNVNYKATVIK